MGKAKENNGPDGVIGPDSFVANALTTYGLQPKDVRVHISDTRSKLIVDGPEPVARFVWTRRNLPPPPKDSKRSKEERKKREKLKKSIKKTTRRISTKGA